MNDIKPSNDTDLYADAVSSQQIDPFSDSVLKNIDPAIKRSFNKTQIDAVIGALRRGQQRKKHAIDIRGLIPLFFVRYYFVFLLGRDSRRYTVCLEKDRRKRSQYVAGIYVGLLVAVIFLFVAFTIAYTFKSFIGIDLIPTRHFQDFF